MGDRTTVLLGAGASAGAGLPMSVGLTAKVVEILENRPLRDRDPVWALNAAIGALIAHKTIQRESALDGVDIETLFSAIKMLAERDSLEVAPFIGSWNASVITGETRSNLRMNWGRDLISLITSSRRQDERKFEKRLLELIDSRIDKGDSVKLYERLQQSIIEALHEALRLDESSDVGYLAPLLELPDETRIATLNYDATIETAASTVGKPVDTGVQNWAGGFDWAWNEESEGSVKLLKLHGSLDWYYDISGPSFFERKRVVVNQPNGPMVGESAVIFGQREKLRSSGPFLAMLNELQRWLDETHHLVVVGYSFRDDHINVALSDWLHGPTGRRMTLVDPTFPEDGRWRHPRDARESLARLAAGSQPGASGGSQTAQQAREYKILRERAETAIPKITG